MTQGRKIAAKCAKGGWKVPVSAVLRFPQISPDFATHFPDAIPDAFFSSEPCDFHTNVAASSPPSALTNSCLKANASRAATIRRSSPVNPRSFTRTIAAFRPSREYDRPASRRLVNADASWTSRRKWRYDTHLRADVGLLTHPATAGFRDPTLGAEPPVPSYARSSAGADCIRCDERRGARRIASSRASGAA